MIHALPVPFAVLILAIVLPCQGVGPAAPAGLQRLLATQCVPLHTQPQIAGQPDYGWWAGGPDWKASFHDGFTFHPYRGPDRELVGMHWHTQSVTVGGEPLSLERLGTTATHDRHVTRYRDVHEVYELRPEGVEQLFVIPRRPAHGGELVVTGGISGEIAVPERGPAHRELTLTADGEPAVRYGRAFAFDADGRRIAIATSAEPGRIRLHVPAAFVAAARFPLTIDPLVGAQVLSNNTGGGVITAVSMAASTALDQLVVSFVRRFASNDTDAYSLYADPGFSNVLFHWIDNAAGYGTPDVDVAYCAGSRTYVIAHYRTSGTSATIPYVYVQRDDQMFLNTGTFVAASSPIAGQIWSEPTVGGGYGSCDLALVAWTFVDNLATPVQKRVRCGLVDGNTPAVGILLCNPHGAVSVDDSDQPDVMAMTRDGLPWRVAWRGRAGATQEIRVATVAQSGASAGYVAYETTTDDLHTPQIAGAYGPNFQLRQVLVWERDAPLNSWVRAYDFSANGPRTIASGPGLSLHDLLADDTTGSNFLMTYSTIVGLGTTTFVARLGGSGAIVDTEALGQVGPAGVCFDRRGAPDFPIAYDVGGFLQQLRGTTFVYPVDAESVPYGAGCSAAAISGDYPFAGNRNFAVLVRNLPSNTPVVLAVNIAQASVSLAPLGIPCALLVSPVGVIPLAAISTGPDVWFPIPLPDDPVFVGDLYVQALLPFGAAGATSGLRIQVR